SHAHTPDVGGTAHVDFCVRRARICRDDRGLAADDTRTGCQTRWPPIRLRLLILLSAAHAVEMILVEQGGCAFSEACGLPGNVAPGTDKVFSAELLGGVRELEDAAG